MSRYNFQGTYGIKILDMGQFSYTNVRSNSVFKWAWRL